MTPSISAGTDAPGESDHMYVDFYCEQLLDLVIRPGREYVYRNGFALRVSSNDKGSSIRKLIALRVEQFPPAARLFLNDYFLARTNHRRLKRIPLSEL